MQLVSKILTLFILVSCQFESNESSSGLIAGNQNVTNAFTFGAPSSGARIAGNTIEFTLTHPYAIDVTGAPTVDVVIGASTVQAALVAGDGTKTLTFRYTVQPGDMAINGIQVLSPISLNGGALEFTGTQGLMNANLSFTTPNLSSVRVDTLAPSITSVEAPSNGTYRFGMPLVFKANFSKNITVTGVPRLALTVGALLDMQLILVDPVHKNYFSHIPLNKVILIIMA
jgi:large repetitive protein